VKVTETQAENYQSQSERHLQAKLELIQRQLEFVTEQLNKGKGKRPMPPPPPAGVLNRLRSSFPGPGTSDQVSTGSNSVDGEDPPAYSSVVDPDPPVPPAPKEKTIWIKKVELLLNGIPLDQLDTSETQVISVSGDFGEMSLAILSMYNHFRMNAFEAISSFKIILGLAMVCSRMVFRK